jgi:hypothetical protein
VDHRRRRRARLPRRTAARHRRSPGERDPRPHGHRARTDRLLRRVAGCRRRQGAGRANRSEEPAHGLGSTRVCSAA